MCHHLFNFYQLFYFDYIVTAVIFEGGEWLGLVLNTEEGMSVAIGLYLLTFFSDYKVTNLIFEFDGCKVESEILMSKCLL